MPIKGFEKQTKLLSKLEMELTQKFLPILQQAMKDNHKVANHELISHFEKFGFTLRPERVRAIIHYLRSTSEITMGGQVYFLLADSTGYWLSSDLNEIAGYAESLTQRYESIRSIRDSAHAFIRRAGGDTNKTIGVQKSLL